MAMSSYVAPQASLVMQNAFDHFSNRVSAHDVESFNKSSMVEFRHDLLELERQLAERGALRNMRRLEFFLNRVETFAETAQFMYSEPSLLSWLWSPVLASLQIAADNLDALDVLISTYRRVSLALPDPEIVSGVNGASPAAQQLIALLYADILSLNEKIYASLKRPGWSLFFNSWMAQFSPRFEMILSNLADQSQLLARNIASTDIPDYTGLMQLRDRRNCVVESQERDMRATLLRNVQAWLQGSCLEQEDLLDDLQIQCHAGSCDWIQSNPRMQSWLGDGPEHRVLWLKGKPGAGKSILCASLIRGIHLVTKPIVLYFFFVHTLVESQNARSLFQSLVQQILKYQPDLCGFASGGLVDKGEHPTLKQLRQLFINLLDAFTSVRIILDGLDECSEKDQRAILNEVQNLTAGNQGSRLKMLKVLISSQDVLLISRTLRARSSIDLSEERAALETAISAFVRSRVASMQIFSDSEDNDSSELKRLEFTLLNKADGMFLWVHLVISMLDHVYSIEEMQSAIDDLPEGLNEVYDRIFLRFRTQTSPANLDRALRILYWLTCSQRPLKRFELQHAITLHHDNMLVSKDKRLFDHVFELCKPLVEINNKDVVSFVHSSVKELYPRPFFMLLTNSGYSYLRNHQKLFSVELAEENTIIACAAYLNFGITLIDEDYDKNFKLCEIGKGFHHLCRYAATYWTEHLLAYVELASRSRQLGTEDPVLRAVSSFAVNLMRTHKPPPPSSSDNKLDERCRHLQDHEPLNSLIQSTLTAQLREKIVARPENESAVSKDPFISMKQQFDRMAGEVLQSTSIPGMKDWELASFKKVCGSSIIVCRHSGCQQGLRGFDTIADRDKHEATHVLVCPHLDCFAHRLGLKNASKLRRHLQEYHPEGSSAASVPNSIKKRTTPQLTIATNDLIAGILLPGALLAQYPALRSIDWSSADAHLADVLSDGHRYSEDLLHSPTPDQSDWGIGQSEIEFDYFATMFGTDQLVPTFLNMPPVITWEPKVISRSSIAARDPVALEIQNLNPISDALLDSPLPDSAKSNSNTQEEEEYTIKCICINTEDDDHIVYCDKCDTWQHIECNYHDQKVPDEHFCLDCLPGDLDPWAVPESDKEG